MAESGGSWRWSRESVWWRVRDDGVSLFSDGVRVESELLAKRDDWKRTEGKW